MILKRFLRKISQGIKYRIEQIYIENLASDFVIPKTVKISGSRVSGKVSFQGYNRISNGVTIQAKSLVKIGRYTTISGPNTDVYASINSVTIGAFCSIARNVAIQEFNHSTNRATTFYMLKNVFDEPNNNHDSKGGIEIGNDVWVGTQSVILSGAKVGDGVIIAANSVVSGVIPPYAIIGGTPAKIIKYRFDEEIIEKLLTMEWWHWDIKKIIQNRAFFETPLTPSHFDNIIE